MDFQDKLAELGLDRELDSGIVETRRKGALDSLKLLLKQRLSDNSIEEAYEILEKCSYAELLFVVDRISEIKTLDDLKKLL